MLITLIGAEQVREHIYMIENTFIYRPIYITDMLITLIGAEQVRDHIYTERTHLQREHILFRENTFSIGWGS
jgi:hypothetical protein